MANALNGPSVSLDTALQLAADRLLERHVSPVQMAQVAEGVRAAREESKAEIERLRQVCDLAAEALALGFDPQDAIDLLEGRTTVEFARAAIDALIRGDGEAGSDA